jgi:polysaccharide export outer membrane protein
MVKNKHVTRILCSLALVFMSSCRAGKNADTPRSNPAYAYTPPVFMATPTPEPHVEDPAEEEAIGENLKKEKKGFWSFLSRNKDKEDLPEESSPERAGDEEAEEDGSVVDAVEKGVDVETTYKLKPGDTILISLSGSGGLSEQIETIIDEQGGVKLRFIGSVKAQGKTTTELEDEIEAEYTDRQKIYKEVVARVLVPNTFYFVGGEVRQPGRFPLLGRVTLSQAIPAAGNFTEWADNKKIILSRGDERYVINFRDIAADPTQDIELQPGDVVNVERRTFL